MIEKLVTIKNISRFENCSPLGDVHFDRLTVVYSENGRGKSVLAAILRSLAAGDPRPIEERKTLGAAVDPFVQVRLSTGMATYKAGAWNKTCPQMEVFDAHFTHSNVYSGLSVDQEHRKNLYGFTIGQRGVELARRIEDLAGQARDLGVARAEHAVSKVAGSVPPKDFADLKVPEDISRQVAEATQELKILEQAHVVREGPEFKSIALPTVDMDELRGVLDRTIESLSVESEEAVKRHLAESLDASGEEWLRQGVGYAKATCPFCAALLEGNRLVEAYRAYFDEGYVSLRKQITDCGTVSEALRTASVDVLTVLEHNQRCHAFWSAFLPLEPWTTGPSRVIRGLQDLAREVQAALNKKLQAPLEPVCAEATLEEAYRRYKEIQREAESDAARALGHNSQISELKHRTDASSLAAARARRQGLAVLEARTLPEARTACSHYVGLLAKKKELETEKARAKADLDTHTASVFRRYQAAINHYLGLFAAGFRIVDVGTSFAGGTPRSEYRIEINGQVVGLSPQVTPSPCFGNTLSEGDKTSLALAFFLARLDGEGNLGDKIVVLDDPISSLDMFRKTATVHRISFLAQTCRQVIVLTHDPYFAREICRAHPQPVRTLWIHREGERQSTLAEWSVTEATRSSYYRHYFSLANYLESASGEPRSVADSIRLLLEENLRIRFPKDFGPGEWLGDFIGKVSASRRGDRIHVLKSQLAELQEINDYAKRFHHTEPDVARDSVTTIDGSELAGYARRTLALAQGVYPGQLGWGPVQSQVS